MAILNQLGSQHPCLNAYLCPGNMTNTLFWQREEELPLADYLQRSSLTLSLSTKLHIMSQICSFLQFCHKKLVGCCLEMSNLFVTRGLELRVRGFKRSWTVPVWMDSKKESNDKPNYKHLIDPDKLFFKHFPYRLVSEYDLESEKCDVLSLGVCLYRILMDKFPFVEGSC